MSFQSARERGRLIPALAISVILHILLLGTAVPFDRAEETALPLIATLRRAADKVSKPLPPAMPRRTPIEPPPPADAVREPEATLSIPATEPNIAPVSTAELPQRSGIVAAGDRGAAAAASSAVALKAQADTPDSDGLRQYRLALALEAKRYKRYPARAMEAGLGGTVEVRVAVADGGQAREVDLARSSGHAMLDDAALEMIRRAAPRTTVPERLRGGGFSVSLPVVFDLSDQ